MPWVNQTTQRPPLTTWFTVQWSEKPSAHGHHQIRRRLLPRRRPNPRIASPTLFTGASLSLGLNQLHGSRQHNSSHLRRCQQERDHRKWTASPAPIRNGRNRSLNQHHASRRPFVHPVQQPFNKGGNNAIPAGVSYGGSHYTTASAEERRLTDLSGGRCLNVDRLVNSTARDPSCATLPP
jgi:hypothetical protein